MLAIDFEGLESKEGVSNSKKAFKRKKNDISQMASQCGLDG